MRTGLEAITVGCWGDRARRITFLDIPILKSRLAQEAGVIRSEYEVALGAFREMRKIGVPGTLIARFGGVPRLQ